MKTIAPSILNANNLQLGQEIEQAVRAGIHRFHIDIMDGHFVPNLSYGPQLVSDFKAAYPAVTAEIHLMVDELSLIEKFAAAGADLIEFHYEAAPEQVDHWLDYLHGQHVQAGLVLNPETPVAVVQKFLPKLDQILLMTVHPGFGGQSFLPESLKRLQELRQLVGPDFPVEVDGGINDQTGRKASAAGANVFVAGSYIFGGKSIAEQVKQLQQAL
ncbi:MAG: ribulose-phosphate 3-epimerase [Lactobacillus sp.]|jgi:ribulose-phosphate 3-epimerase|nr:ribulose-phosphate 3-epimerase [Lactobacillus sp.]